MNPCQTLKRGWFEWTLLPLKVFVLLAVAVIPFADSSSMPAVPALDMDLDVLVGWLCLLCSLVFVVASVIQKSVSPEGTARAVSGLRCWLSLSGRFYHPCLRGHENVEV